MAQDQCKQGILYHTKNYQGTTTQPVDPVTVGALYHTKNYQGTTTRQVYVDINIEIIPYQELPGNYNYL